MNREMVDPQLIPLLDSFPAITMSDQELPKLREMFGSQALPVTVGTDVNIDQHVFSSEDGGPDIRVLEFRPAVRQPRMPAVLYIHGGGFALGSPEMLGAANIGIAQALNCVVFSVDYRLAPETRYPGALQDCYSTLKGIHSRATQLGIDERKIALVGESAGGGLAAALSLFVRDNSGPNLCFQLLVAPMLDDRTGQAIEQNPFTGKFVWTRESNRYAWRALLRSSADNAPARSEDLSNLKNAQNDWLRALRKIFWGN